PTVVGEQAPGDRGHAGRNDEGKKLVARDIDTERLRHRLSDMDGPPGAAAATAQQIDADQQARNSGHEQDEIPTASPELESGETRRINHNPGRESALGFIFAAQIDNDEMQSQRADRQIETAQPQGRKSENESEHDTGESRSWERDPERRGNLARKDSGGEC